LITELAAPLTEFTALKTPKTAVYQAKLGVQARKKAL
jgi:hypothetical protein